MAENVHFKSKQNILRFSTNCRSILFTNGSVCDFMDPVLQSGHATKLPSSETPPEDPDLYPSFSNLAAPTGYSLQDLNQLSIEPPPRQLHAPKAPNMNFAPYQDTSPEIERALSPPPQDGRRSKSPMIRSPPPSRPFSPTPPQELPPPRVNGNVTSGGFQGARASLEAFETSLPMRMDVEASMYPVPCVDCVEDCAHGGQRMIKEASAVVFQYNVSFLNPEHRS